MCDCAGFRCAGRARLRNGSRPIVLWTSSGAAPIACGIHEHTFTPQDGGTLAKDTVRYAVLGGAIVQRLFVTSELKRIFQYRNAALKDHFSR